MLKSCVRNYQLKAMIGFKLQGWYIWLLGHYCPEIKKLEVIVNMPELLRTLPEKGQLRTRIGASHNDIIALYQGVICAERGLEELLRVSELIENPRIRFVVIGMDS